MIVRTISAVAISATLVACAPDVLPTATLTGDGPVFLALATPPDASMDALFQGIVSVDDKGCIRLGTTDGHTVIWPHGFTLVRRGDTFAIANGAGDEVGVLGGSFRFGGGEVPGLHSGIALSAADRARADSACPGRYWIVAG